MLAVELGRLCSRMGKYKDAEHWYRGAVRLDEACFPALVGLAHCQMRDASSTAEDLAKQQVDFLAGAQGSGPALPELLLMSAELVRAEPVKAVSQLNRAASILSEVKTVAKIIELVTKLCKLYVFLL